MENVKVNDVVIKYDDGITIDFGENFPFGATAQFNNGDVAEVVLIEGSTCRVPDGAFGRSGICKIYVQLADDESFKTLRTYEVKVKDRHPVEEEIAPEHQPTFIESVSAILEDAKDIADDLNAKAESGYFNGADGADGADGAPGPQGETGPAGPAGADGTNGADGFSPIASVERVSGGAKITITDAEGTTEAIVYDGEGGGGTVSSSKVWSGYSTPTIRTSDYNGIKINDLYIDLNYRSLYIAKMVTSSAITWDSLVINDGIATSKTAYSSSKVDTLLSSYVEKEDGKSLSTNDYTDAEKTKLEGLENYDDTEIKNQIKIIDSAEGDAAADVAITCPQNTEVTFKFETAGIFTAYDSSDNRIDYKRYYDNAVNTRTTPEGTSYIKFLEGGAHYSFKTNSITSQQAYDILKSSLNQQSNDIVALQSDVEELQSQIVTCTQAEYDAITIKSPTTIYVITDGE